MWTRRGLVIAVGALVLLTGCASGLEPQPVEVRDPFPTDGSLRTDNHTYTASCKGEGYAKTCTFTLTMSYTNKTNGTVYFNHCYPDDTFPIYFVGGLTEEESAYSGAWGCTGHDRFVKVLAEEQRVDTLRISGPNAWDGVTGEPFGLLEGHLQIFYEAFSCSNELDPCELPREAATSNVFTVNLPD